tara:strand:+ start:1057 stop:1563 length:507 start_codon:yes stop_codon:yes gene_type:complete
MTDDTKLGGPTKATKRKQSTVAERPTASDARAQLAVMRAKEEEKALEQEMAEEAGHDWFVRCKGCNGVAVFLTRHPKSGTVSHDGWYSDYKGVDDKYMASEIPCQECGMPIQAEFPQGIQGGWVIGDRHVQSIKDIERRTQEAERERKEQKAMHVARMSMISTPAGDL